jgi:hypothetical protein
LNSVNILGKWYAADALRYYSTTHKNVSYYKMYITSVDEATSLIVYDSFVLFEDGAVQPLKVNREASLVDFMTEVKDGHLVRTRSEFRPNMNTSLRSIGDKYGLNIVCSVS